MRPAASVLRQPLSDLQLWRGLTSREGGARPPALRRKRNDVQRHAEGLGADVTPAAQLHRDGTLLAQPLLLTLLPQLRGVLQDGGHEPRQARRPQPSLSTWSGLGLGLGLGSWVMGLG
eukprot:scaffold24087_cov44-Phaeocystis_antarctica.AAC.2